MANLENNPKSFTKASAKPSTSFRNYKNQNMDNNTPTVVKIHDVNIDKDYIGWIEELKYRYRKAQIKAAVKVNAEQLLFNWQLGRDLVTRKAEEQWGSGVVEQLSMDLQAAFPESKGFSTTNFWRMKQWYQFYSDALKKLPQLVGELQLSENQSNTKLHRLWENLKIPTSLHYLRVYRGGITQKLLPNAKQ